MHDVTRPWARVRGLQRPAGTVDGGHGTVPAAAAEVDTTRDLPETRRVSARDAERLLQAEMIQACRDLQMATTEITARLAGTGAVNGVLDVALLAIPAGGLLTLDYPVTVGSVVVVSHGDAVTVQAGGAAGAAPTAGRGLQICPAGGRLAMPVAGREVTLYGTADDQVSVQVYTGLQALGIGSL